MSTDAPNSRPWMQAAGRFWPWAAGGAAALLLAGAGIFFLRPRAPRTTAPAPVEGRLGMNAAQRRLSDDIGESERKYLRLHEAGQGETDLLPVIEQAIEQQRELLRQNPHAGIEQEVRLERLLAARDTERGRANGREIEQLIDAADAERKAGRTAVALEKLRVALRLQRDVDNSNADNHTKNFVREMELVQTIETAEAEPVAQEFETAMQQARTAVAAQRWAEALAAYERARDAQVKINRDFARTRFTNLPVLDEIEAEIASLNAAGLAAQIDERERQADAAAERGRVEEAAGFYKAAADQQRTLNAQFARSRFVSTARLETIEVKRQTVLAAELLKAAAQLDREAAAALLKRQVVAAETKIRAGAKLLADVARDYPKAQGFDGALKIKLAFLELRAAELRVLQDQVYERLVPLPESKNVLMLKTETPQLLYAKVMSQNPSRNPGTAYPVDSVSWNDAQEFCRRLSWLLGTPVRLPTETEFRTGCGDGEAAAWSAENAGGHSQETAKLAANETGFCDLTGNLAEWLAADPSGAKAAVAGGSYLDAAASLRPLRLVAVDRGERARHIGFRFVVETAAE